MSDDHCVVLTTAADAGEARTIARALVAGGLAACVQMSSVDSVYTWRGEVTEDSEVLLLIKTRRDRYEAVESTIVSLHSYEVPEVVMLPIERGLDRYIDWMDAATEAGDR